MFGKFLVMFGRFPHVLSGVDLSVVTKSWPTWLTSHVVKVQRVVFTAYDAATITLAHGDVIKVRIVRRRFVGPRVYRVACHATNGLVQRFWTRPEAVDGPGRMVEAAFLRYLESEQDLRGRGLGLETTLLLRRMVEDGVLLGPVATAVMEQRYEVEVDLKRTWHCEVRLAVPQLDNPHTQDAIRRAVWDIAQELGNIPTRVVVEVLEENERSK